MPGNKTYFNVDWINPEINPEWANWLQADPNSPFSAYCVKCRKKFSLGNMGISAIKKHASGEHHKKILISENSKMTVSSMFKKNTVKSEESSVIQAVTKSSSDSNKKISANTALDDFVIKNNVTSAEILWAIRLILKHDSYNSCEFDNYFFKRMFLDSEISNKFSMGPDKAHYLITYGLSPYFESLQKAQLLKSEAFVICFDEAINKIAQKGQMDLHVRFWCESNQQVSTRYLNSAFLGKAAAENMLESFLEIMNPFSLEKILQVSMDGPSVNFKFLKLLKSHMESMNEDSSKLLDIGSCGLHVINGAFQTGCNETGWKVRKFLSALYYLFKDSPSRRAEYSLVTGCSIFPKKFCRIRWLENASCAERAMLIFQNVKEYIAEKKIISNGNSATTVEECLRNPLMLAQLAFFKLMSEEFQPFLTRFQTAEPLSPYLYTSVLELTKNLMRRFVKKNVLDNATTAKQIAAIDLTNKENLVNIKELDIGFSTTKYLNKSKVSDKEKGYFRMECRSFLVKSVNKILEKSPILFTLTRGISCLVPSLIVLNPSIAQQRMDVCLRILNENNRICDSTAEKAKKEFLSFCEFAKKEENHSFKEFEPSKERLDSFFAKFLYKEKRFENIWKVIKLILILSHGNATVEGGFSVNKNMIVQNQHEESLVSRRRVYDYVASCGGIKNIEIDENMLNAVKGARTRWNFALDKKRCEDEDKKKVAMSKKRQQIKIDNLKNKKMKLTETAASELEAIDSEIIKEENVLRNMS